MEKIRVILIERLDLRFEARPWDWADRNRAAIDAHFAKARERQRLLWNGRVLLLHRYAIEDGLFRGTYFETDFASFLAWRDFGFPDASTANCFAMAALRSADGAYLFGRMGAHTANAGKIYFPSGTPDPSDLRDGLVDLEGSVVRELAEETGLGSGDVTFSQHWHVVIDGTRIAMMRPSVSRCQAEQLKSQIRVHLQQQRNPELSDIIVVRSSSDVRPEMPGFVRAYLEYVWSSVS
jgi:8-oxo-dGTP pyrophosphatase MutT (NUDIX family)